MGGAITAAIGGAIRVISDNFHGAADQAGEALVEALGVGCWKEEGAGADHPAGDLHQHAVLVFRDMSQASTHLASWAGCGGAGQAGTAWLRTLAEHNAGLCRALDGKRVADSTTRENFFRLFRPCQAQCARVYGDLRTQSRAGEDSAVVVCADLLLDQLAADTPDVAAVAQIVSDLQPLSCGGSAHYELLLCAKAIAGQPLS
ncbi:MAG: hypothetical protein AAF657_27570 [Acidobacteriota bacterium]